MIVIELTRKILIEIEEVCDHITSNEVNAVLQQINKEHVIFVDGDGRSGLVIKCFAMRLVHLGYRTYVIGETITPAMKPRDIYIGVSGSGTTETVCFQAEKAKSIGCTCIAISAKKESRLAKICDLVLQIPGTIKKDQNEERQSIQLLSSLFDQSLHIIVDMIALSLSYRDKISNEEATNLHY